MDDDGDALLKRLALSDGVIVMPCDEFEKAFDPAVIKRLIEQGLVMDEPGSAWNFTDGIKLTAKGRELMGLPPVGWAVEWRRLFAFFGLRA